MDIDNATYGEQIRSLFESAKKEVQIIAPFIKTNALKSLLDVLPKTIELHCITRWRLEEVIAGVSDPEVYNTLESRGNSTLYLVDNLHAKIFIADHQCLAGSANVTLAGLGGNSNIENIEILLETTTSDQNITTTLAKISESKRQVTRSMMEDINQFVNISLDKKLFEVKSSSKWLPCSKKPKSAFKIYSNPSKKHMLNTDHILIADLVKANLPFGLNESEFKAEICSLLLSIPLAKIFLEETRDTTLSQSDANLLFEEIEMGNFTKSDLWLSFVEWMSYFFPEKVMKHEISEIALRRAQIL